MDIDKYIYIFKEGSNPEANRRHKAGPSEIGISFPIVVRACRVSSFIRLVEKGIITEEVCLSRTISEAVEGYLPR